MVTRQAKLRRDHAEMLQVEYEKMVCKKNENGNSTILSATLGSRAHVALRALNAQLNASHKDVKGVLAAAEAGAGRQLLEVPPPEAGTERWVLEAPLRRRDGVRADLIE